MEKTKIKTYFLPVAGLLTGMFFCFLASPFSPNFQRSLQANVLRNRTQANVEPSYKAEFFYMDAINLLSHTSKEVTVRIKNTGMETWSSKGKSAIQLTPDANAAASDFVITPAILQQESVAPGKTAAFTFTITASGRVADYLLNFELSTADKKSFIMDIPVSLGITVATKKVALTFDDGYGDVGAFIDLLNSKNIRGTFFMVGYAAEKNQDAMRRIVNEGHMLADHSYGHPDFRTLTDDEIRWQLNQTREYLLKITGKDVYPYFRYPYGAMNERTNNVLKEDGWKYFPWTQDTTDWKYHQDSEAGRQHIYHYATLNPPEEAIVLMHTMSKSSLAVLPDVIQWYRDHGYSFVTVDEL